MHGMAATTKEPLTVLLAQLLAMSRVRVERSVYTAELQTAEADVRLAFITPPDAIAVHLTPTLTLNRISWRK